MAPAPACGISDDRQRNSRPSHHQQCDHAEQRQADDEQQRQGDDGCKEDCVEQAAPDRATVQVRSASPEHASIPPQNDVAFVATSYSSLAQKDTRFEPLAKAMIDDLVDYVFAARTMPQRN